MDTSGEFSLTGRLLVATPLLRDPNFERTVILLLDHDGDGALGVVLNRPSDVLVSSVLPGWGAVVSSPDLVFVGGPVSTDGAVCVGLLPSGVEVPDWARGARGARGTGRACLIDLDAEPIVAGAVMEGMRVFAGYSGWSPDQLEDEIAEGAWWALEARPADLLTEDPAELWWTVMGRQRGPLAQFACYPEDVELN